MVVTKTNREEHLRSKDRFYVAGWGASEFGEQPQARPENYKYPKLYASYMEGYSVQKRNEHCVSAVSGIHTPLGYNEVYDVG